MKGILLAGGRGTRLWPNTAIISKQLLPIYDKPMIYYPLTTLMLAGITEIAVITNPEHEELFKNLLGDGNKWGLKFHYVPQQSPTGIPDVLKLAPKSFYQDSVMVVLGDNFLYGMGLGASLKEAYPGSGALVFSYKVNNPSDYGVVVVDKDGYAISLEEKPADPKSDLAIPGIYFLDSDAYEVVNTLKPSARGETEITDLLNHYLEKKQLKVQQLARGTAWLDTGSFDNLLGAGEFVRVLEKRQGLKIGCPEEVALRENLISREKFLLLTNEMPKSDYLEYLLKL
jgi:glucose-1-phosphate thymidylyltransferase